MKTHRLESFEEGIVSFRNYSAKDSNKNELDKMKQYMLVAMKNELTERQRDCVIQHFLYGKSYTEIAQELDIHMTTVSFHVKQGIKKLKKTTVYFDIFNRKKDE